jgi:hypothetical protein
MGAAEYQGREPDSCDLNGDTAFNRTDSLIWIRGCRLGTSAWACDVNGDGSTTQADIVAHVASCGGIA